MHECGLLVCVVSGSGSHSKFDYCWIEILSEMSQRKACGPPLRPLRIWWALYKPPVILFTHVVWPHSQSPRQCCARQLCGDIVLFLLFFVLAVFGLFFFFLSFFVFAFRGKIAQDNFPVVAPNLWWQVLRCTVADLGCRTQQSTSEPRLSVLSVWLTLT